MISCLIIAQKAHATKLKIAVTKANHTPGPKSESAKPRSLNFPKNTANPIRAQTPANPKFVSSPTQLEIIFYVSPFIVLQVDSTDIISTSLQKPIQVYMKCKQILQNIPLNLGPTCHSKCYDSD